MSLFMEKQPMPLEFYQAADVFLLPSLEEGLPTVLLEAMSSGLPCIATRIGGVTDVLQNEREGLMITPGSIEELSDAMKRMMSQPERRPTVGQTGARNGHGEVRSRRYYDSIHPYLPQPVGR